MELNKLKLIESIRPKISDCRAVNDKLSPLVLYDALLEDRKKGVTEKPVLGTEIYQGGKSKIIKTPKTNQLKDEHEEQVPKNNADEIQQTGLKADHPATQDPVISDRKTENTSTPPSIDEIEGKDTSDFVAMASFSEAEKKALLSTPPELWHPLFTRDLIAEYSDFVKAQKLSDGDAVVRCIDSDKNQIDVPYKYLDRYYFQNAQVTLKLGESNVDFLEMKGTHNDVLSGLQMGSDTVLKYKEGNTDFFDRDIPPGLLTNEAPQPVLPSVSKFLVNGKTKGSKPVKNKEKGSLPKKKKTPKETVPLASNDVPELVSKPAALSEMEELKQKLDNRLVLPEEDLPGRFAQRAYAKGYKTLDEITSAFSRGKDIANQGLNGTALNKALNGALKTEFPLKQ